MTLISKSTKDRSHVFTKKNDSIKSVKCIPKIYKSNEIMKQMLNENNEERTYINTHISIQKRIVKAHRHNKFNK